MRRTESGISIKRARCYSYEVQADDRRQIWKNRARLLIDCLTGSSVSRKKRHDPTGLGPNEFNLLRVTHYAEDHIVPINAADIMTRQLITARPDNTVAEVARLLSEHDISALPICDNDGTLLGMISESDLMLPFRQKHSLRRAWWLGILSFGDPLMRALADYVHEGPRRAGELMTHPVITATETATPVEIADLLLRYNIKRVPIMRDHQLLGIVSRTDLIRSLVRCPVTFSDCGWQPSTVGSDRPAAIPRRAI